MAEAIQIRGARVHNLKNIDVDLPLHAWTVVTGVSGSGKSSLAFDTIYAEGQRRYVESLSAYARQFLERMEKPEVESIDGIAPAVAIRQKTAGRNPRSTVATATEIYDYLRLLFARVGTTICPDCGLAAERHDVDTAVERLLGEADDRRCLVLFPLLIGAGPSAAAPRAALMLAPGQGGELAARLADLRGRGFQRLWQSGRTFEFGAPEMLLDLDRTQPIFVVADRVVVEPDARARLVEAIETGYREAGEAVVEFPDALAGGGKAAPLRLHQAFECSRCRRRFQAPEPSLFAFNNPVGACPNCQGFGRSAELAEARVVPNPDLTLEQGAIEPWNRPRGLRWRNALRQVAAREDIPLDRPWRQLSAEQRRKVWNGVPKFPGVTGFFRVLEKKKYSVHMRVFISRYREYSPCTVCGGQRLRPEALWVQLSGRDGRRHTISTLATLTVEAAAAFLDQLDLAPEATVIAGVILLELRRRLEFLLKVGLEYLTLDRLAATLSGGEAQRIQLATCLGAQLVGSLYVLDEPSIGLHPRDTARLTGILRELRDLGNTILVVEHDPEVMRASDYLVDMGPGAGEGGGSVVAAGPWRAVAANPASLTGRYLSGTTQIPVPGVRRTPTRALLEIRGATANNLHDLDVEIPLGMLVAVTGVSGSGKSTLVHEVLHQNLKRALHGAEEEGGKAAAPAPRGRTAATTWTHCQALRGTAHVNEVVLVDQSPIGRTPRSNPVTYLKAFDGIRELFASQPAAKRRGLRAGDFSFNVPGGRCETCQGEGVVTVDMQFLADVELVCEECDGTRYQASTLSVEFNGRNLHQVLQLTVREALSFFSQHERIVRPLRVLDEIGLGYVRLGQSATTLSGGEAQRVKLAAHLAQPRAANGTLFLLDEPTTGLHFDDIAKLLAAFERLIAAGGSVVVIEHNLEVIKSADWVLDLGPEAGARGGHLVAEGPPEVIAGNSASRLAPYLRNCL